MFCPLTGKHGCYPSCRGVGQRPGVSELGVDEFMLVCDVFDPALRLRSLDITAAAHAAKRRAGHNSAHLDAGYTAAGVSPTAKLSLVLQCPKVTGALIRA